MVEFVPPLGGTTELLPNAAVNPAVDEAFVVRATADAKLFTEVKVTVEFPELPACTSKPLGYAETKKPGSRIVRAIVVDRLRVPLTPSTRMS